ncbi:putative DNA glycosylase [Cyphellophora attinorum]|uniref:Putative DNA glycosylase n=1 Tax=Cyphellophora attinorum TaxID=1664694 RepID=A0A0N1HRD4_9EURO|nr:putative DNA glycosylase [Phialophora attinorum]KPI40785.1 putative DNA glycosylase [Phialophora attinorum]
MAAKKATNTKPKPGTISYKKSKSTTTKVTVATTAEAEDTIEVNVDSTTYEVTTLTAWLSDLSPKRKAEDDADGEYQEVSPSKKSKVDVVVSGPSLSTRGQTRVVKNLLLEGVPGTDKIHNAKAPPKPTAKLKAPRKYPKAGVKSSAKQGAAAARGPMNSHVANTFRIKLSIDLEKLGKTRPALYNWYESLKPAPVEKLARVTSADRHFWDHFHYKVKFGESPWPSLLSPTYDQSYEVFNILVDWLHKEHKIFVDKDGSSSAGENRTNTDDRTIDVIVRTIMAQGTTNELALTAQQEMRVAYPYSVNGQNVVGSVPNYHLMRVQGEARLRGVIDLAGFGNKRPAFIMATLDTIYERNIANVKAHNNCEIPPNTEMGQPANVGYFVPGMLSIEELISMDKIDVHNLLLSIPGIGVKTAHCVMAFNLGIDINAVDTHVMKAARNLNWLADHIKTEIKAFNHLDGRLPPGYKRGIHQVLWHHGVLCKRCKRNAAKDDVREGEPACPIEHLVTRRDTKEASQSSPRQRKKSESPKAKVVKVKGKKVYLEFDAFASSEEAAAAGYAAFDVPIDDDFDSGSANTRIWKRWRLIKAEEVVEEEVEEVDEEEETEEESDIVGGED